MSRKWTNWMLIANGILYSVIGLIGTWIWLTSGNGCHLADMCGVHCILAILCMVVATRD